MREIIIADPPHDLSVSAGTPPMLQWVRIADLVIDDSYQRELGRENWRAIRRIAEGFKWSRFSPVFVAPVEGGKYALIDGQHRTHAAAMCGFQKVPCQIVQMTREEQAASFAAVNGMVTKVTSIQVFKAKVREGDPVAVRAVKVAEAAGCKLRLENRATKDKNPGDIFAPKAFLDLIDLKGEEAIRTALSALMKAEGYGDVTEVWDIQILEPLVLALTANPILTSGKMVELLEEMPLYDLIEKVRVEIQRRLRLALPYKGRKQMRAEAFEGWMLSRIGGAA